MTGKVPHAAFCEEYDEDANVILPETRQVAHIAAKRSRADLRSGFEPLVDGASDSGYSSRTAATVNSAQSGPSGRKSPVPLKLDTTLKRADLEKIRSSRKDRAKEKPTRPVRDDKMQVGTYPSSSHYAASPVQRSPSRPRRRDSVHVRHVPGTCWDCDQGLYHASTPVEPRRTERPYYVSQRPPSVHDYPPPPPSPQTRYPPSVIQDVHVSHSSRPSTRTARSNSYHSNARPSSFHGMMPGMGAMVYTPSPMSRYEAGPPLASPVYPNSPYYAQPSPYYGVQEFAALPSTDHHQERSVSKTGEKQPRPRRASLYGPPVLDHVPPTPPYDESEDDDEEDDDDESDDEQLLEPPPPPPVQARPRLPSHSSRNRDEDYYRMPPPPIKNTTRPHIIQKRPDPPRKSATTTSLASERRSSRSFDLSEMEDALPSYGYRRSSRETVVPERSQSLRGTRRSTSYHDSVRPARIAIEGARRQRTTVYDYHPGGDIEDKQREAEEYQASRSGKAVAVPLTADALRKAKSSQRAASDSGSQKSRSSRGSDARTQNGSNGEAKPEEDENIVMTMNGVTMSFSQKSVGGKRISVRTGETGAVELNIEGKRPKKYLTGGSDYTGSVSRRELEDPRRPRGDRRSDKASNRSSRSTYSGRY
ncbi:hypothetical protein CDV55_108424 [Aspergillus turcosus]|uniref:Uncharacterized protein n=1 Tax=Aspergillus turcosus TaxID=1245748 RepID=A0A229XMM6_9EURO|nr:hypothetical protein CDV55_108424 [Aspergillus turcosus]RLM01892.1 hypothetical protein CFD26_105938 [Aspergillus turcosus]